MDESDYTNKSKNANDLLEKMDGQYYNLLVENTDTSIIIMNNNGIIVRINNGDEIDNSISYYDNEYQEYIDVPKSLDINNSFTI